MDKKMPGALVQAPGSNQIMRAAAS